MSLGGRMSHKIWKPKKLSWGSALIKGKKKGFWIWRSGLETMSWDSRTPGLQSPYKELWEPSP